MPSFRPVRILFEILRFALGSVVALFPGARARTTTPQRLRLSLARLGTTFIKFGQAMSLRRDILPDAYIAALQSLQDDVAPFPTDIAMQEIERGLGSPIKQLFSRFDPAPLAAASIAQVHAARLIDGREVIVKVRRPGIKRQIDQDMRALARLARVAGRTAPRLRQYQPERIVDQIWANLKKEIDFRQEARNIRLFAKAFAEWPDIHIPGVIDDLVSEAVIVQERSRGRRIGDPEIGADGPRLAQNFVHAYLHQIFVLGVFHGDPHPGNLFIMADGRICFHDFGLVGYLDRRTRRQLAAFTSAFLHQDADWMLDAAIDLGILGGDIDRAAFQRGLTDIMTDFASRPFKEWSLAEAFLRVTRLGEAQNVFVPYDLLVLMRTMFLAEYDVGVLDPKFELLEGLRTAGADALKSAMAQADTDGALDRLKLEAFTLLQGIPASLGSLARWLGRNGEDVGLNLRLRGLKGLEEHLDRGANRVALALVALGLYVAGSILMQYGPGPRSIGGMPWPAALAFALALWFTLRLAWGIARSGKL